MKNNSIGLFAVGILTGGFIMFLSLLFLQFPDRSLSDRTPPQTPGLNQLPQLMALEPTSVHLPATQIPVSPIVTAELSPVAEPMGVSLTPTPLSLRNDQQSEIIGYSVDGRSLVVYNFGNGEDEQMIVAGIHGGEEWNTVTLANQLIVYLNQNPEEIPEHIRLYILPNPNPDGEARAHNRYGRLNSNGVDLNRNFPVNWEMDWDRAGCWNYLPTSGGTGPGSEAETQALMNFIGGHNIQALISYHSAALGIFPGGVPSDEDSVRLARSIAGVTSYPFPPIDTGCAYSGTLADYAVASGIAAVDLELTNHFDTDFEQNLRVLNVLLNFVP